jgi:nucleoside-diphosphate-sugar epimerase
MTTFVAGATGATGKLLVQQLLDRGRSVRAVVRSAERLPGALRGHERLSLVTASLLDLTDDELSEQVSGCDSIACCLGHNLTLRGIYGHPRRLVTDATRRLCLAAERARRGDPVRFVLMNTAGNRNRDLDEPVSLGHRCVIGIVRVLVPPHPDNEHAADFLRTTIGQKSRAIEWVVVRPDTLVDADRVSGYQLHPSPTRSAIFDPGKTSRVNVANFMARLLTEDALWAEWKGRMPVVYDA